MIRTFLAAALAVAFLSGLNLDAKAATITWEAPVAMFSGDANDASFINTEGTLVGAANGGSTLAANAVVNGVEFANIAGTNAGGQNLVSGNFSFLNHNDNADAFGQGGFAGGTGGVGDLIQSGIWGAQGVTLTGLTSGEDYLIQILANDARGNRSDNFMAAYGDGLGGTTPGSDPVLLNNQINASGDGPTGTDLDASGNYIIGRFTADDVTQTFQAFGTNSGNIAALSVNDSRAHFNAIQLRNVTAVPEPGSLAVLGLGSLMMFRRRRRSA